jgi:hypothetical protein
MKESKYQQKHFKQRYGQDPEFRAHRQAVDNGYRRDRCANDPEFRSRCLHKQWGMTVQLGRFYEIMRLCGWTPAQNEAGGEPA